MKKESRNWINSLVIIGMVIIFFTNSCEEFLSAPPVVQTNAVTDITSTSVTINGEVISTGGDSSVHPGFYFSNHIIEQNSESGTGIGWPAQIHTGRFSTQVKYLTPGTIYYVEAYAEFNHDADYSYRIGFGKVIPFSTTGSVTGDIQFNPNLTYGSVSDIEGNTYKTIQIGTQTWMAENLKTTKFNDGTVIPNITDEFEWWNRTTGAYCWYLNDIKYKNNYGALYNWYTVNTDKLCPAGWHVPGEGDWDLLTIFLGGTTGDYGSIPCNPIIETGTTHWINTFTGVTNSAGFTVLPGGQRLTNPDPHSNYFICLGYKANFWSSYSIASGRVFSVGGGFSAGSASFVEGDGLSVRCVKD